MEGETRADEQKILLKKRTVWPPTIPVQKQKSKTMSLATSCLGQNMPAQGCLAPDLRCKLLQAAAKCCKVLQSAAKTLLKK